MADDSLTDPHLMCRSSTTLSIATFILINYAAHCATVKSRPGESSRSAICAALFAFFFPAFGITRAWDGIVRHSRFTKGTPLQKACRAGALCMIVRDQWSWAPQANDVINSVHVQELSNPPRYIAAGKSLSTFKPPYLREPLVTFDRDALRNRNIHGSRYLPHGYEFKIVPSNASIDSLQPSSISVVTQISSSDNGVRASVGLAQAVYACFTLYRARGTQIDRYGYAAFGLTVAQYLIMSICNLISQLVTPDYPALYMVRTPEMTEAESRGGQFHGVVGELRSNNQVGCDSIQVLSYADNFQDRRVMFKHTWTDPNSSVVNEETIATEYWPYLMGKYEIPTATDFKRARPDRNTRTHWRRKLITLGPTSISALALVVVGALSGGFKAQSSTTPQRAWTLSWLLVGVVLAPVARAAIAMTSNFKFRHEQDWTDGIIYAVCGTFVLLSCVPAVGGLVVVVQMLRSYGDCSWH